MLHATLVSRQFKRLSFSAYHTTSALQTKSPRKFFPKHWYIVEGGPGEGLELAFFNSKTREATWYTPEGMTAEEILAIPSARKYWTTVEEVKEYMEEMAVEKRESGGTDLIDEMRKTDEFWRENPEKKE